MSQIRHILKDSLGDTEIQVFVFGHRQISKRWMFGNLRFLKSKFSYLTVGEYPKDGCLEILDLDFELSLWPHLPGEPDSTGHATITHQSDPFK